ncbi:MAG: amidohydrolase [Streptosporangiales bacterium]|nr:amidohydrolase [Streptosporangiales bacterium]
MDPAKTTAHAWVDAHRDEVSQWHTTIWNYAEPAWREYRSAAWYVARLRAAGFDVEEGSGGMPTAFAASWTNGPGPTVLTYAEYDAVPHNSQAATTRREPRPGTNSYAPGHTDPHSALGISTLAALLAAKEAMQRHDIPGTLRYTGEPAEKMHGSKPVHGLRGYYDDVDAIVSFHPFYLLPWCNTLRWDTHCGLCYSKIYTFRCDEPQTWAAGGTDSPIPASHSAARAPGANAALFTMYQLTKTTHDAMAPAFGGWSLNEAILHSGQATADNLAPRLAQIQYTWRAPDLATAEQILAVLDRNAQTAAAATHCSVHDRWVARSRPGLPNHTVTELVWSNLHDVGPPRYGDDAVRTAQEMQRAAGVEPTDQPLLADLTQLVEPWEAERRVRELLPPSQRSWTSDDYVEMSWYAPTARLYVGRPALAPRGDGHAYPDWVMNALGGMPATIDPTIECAAKTIGGSLLDLVRDREALAAAHDELARRREEYGDLAPLLPADFTAPHDYGWPDYVDDGTRWCVPEPGVVT